MRKPKQSNGGGRAVVIVVLAVLLAMGTVTGVSNLFDGRETLYTDDFSSSPDGFSYYNNAAYNSNADVIDMASNTDPGAVEYDVGTPTNKSWAVSFVSNYDDSNDNGRTAFKFYADSIPGNSDNAYVVEYHNGLDKVRLARWQNGERTIVASADGATDPMIKGNVSVNTETDTVKVYDGDTQVISHQFEELNTSYSKMGWQAYNGGDTWHNLISVGVYGNPQDTDNDGIYDSEDSYPNNAPKTYDITPTTGGNDTVESVYLEASNGSFTADVYGVNDTSGERILLTSGSKTVTENQLVEFDVTSGFDSYEIEYHGDATVHDYDALYQALSGGSGGGIDSSTFWNGIDSISTQNAVLGVLLLAVGAALFIRIGASGGRS